jgi:hypothetical protein
MSKEKIGLIIFSISTLYMTRLDWLGSWWITTTLRSLILVQINETIWATDCRSSPICRKRTQKGKCSHNCGT